MAKVRRLMLGGSFQELCEQELPAAAIESTIARLRGGGVTRLEVVISMGGRERAPMMEATTAEVAHRRPAFIVARLGRLHNLEEIDWTEPRPFAAALERVVDTVHQFDRVGRFRFAKTDMDLAAHAAEGLIDARENDGPARIFERVLETGMIVTYARPYVEGNQAGVGARWRPDDPADVELHDEILDLRHEYHAHADHTTERFLERVDYMFDAHENRRAFFAESWTRLRVDKLRHLADLARRQAQRFDAEAERRDLELFGPAREDVALLDP
jgi:hypothetical protein